MLLLSTTASFLMDSFPWWCNTCGFLWILHSFPPPISPPRKEDIWDACALFCLSLSFRCAYRNYLPPVLILPVSEVLSCYRSAWYHQLLLWNQLLLLFLCPLFQAAYPHTWSAGTVLWSDHWPVQGVLSGVHNPLSDPVSPSGLL